MSRDGFFQFYALLGGGTVLLMFLGGVFLGRIPHSLINLPNREYWLAPGRKQQAITRLQTGMDWFGFFLALFLYGVLELVLQSNINRAPLYNTLFFLLMGVFLALSMGWTVAIIRAFRIPKGKG